MLDDLFAASETGEGPVRAPSIAFDYLAVADELHSGRIRVDSDTSAAGTGEYRESASDLAAEFAAILDAKMPLPEKLPPVDPESIAAELGLDKLKLGEPGASADFGRLRRRFAFTNHPDRVAPHLRQRAMVRMQIANMLIDDARRKAAAGG